MRRHDIDVAEMFVDGKEKYGAFTDEFLDELTARLGCIPSSRAIGIFNCLMLKRPVADAKLDRLYGKIGNRFGKVLHGKKAVV